MQRGRRVALIDRDPSENLASWADRGGRRKNPELVEIDSTAEPIGLVLAQCHYDLTIIDTPPAILGLVEDTIFQASFVLIPCRASALDLVALDAVVDICKELSKPFAFVLNAVHPQTKTAPGFLRKYGHLCGTMIVDRTAYVAARSAQHVARGIWSPSDDEGHECDRRAMQAVLAHHPTPRRAAPELLEGGSWRLSLHAGSMRLFALTE